MDDTTPPTPADYVLADAMVAEAGDLLVSISELAARLGTTAHLAQVIGALLGVGAGMTSDRITREQFLTIWDVYEREIAQAVTLRPVPVAAGGPEDTAHAATAEEAAALADVWGSRISGIALGAGDPLFPEDARMADTRLFRMTRSWNSGITNRRPRYGKPPPDIRIEYGDRRVASAKCGGGGHSYKYGSVIKVEATDADATTGWTDVTSEFIKEDA